MKGGSKSHMAPIIPLCALVACLLVVGLRRYRAASSAQCTTCSGGEPLATTLRSEGAVVYGSKRCGYCEGLRNAMLAESSSPDVDAVFTYEPPPQPERGVPQIARGQRVVYVGGVPSGRDFGSYKARILAALLSSQTGSN